MAIAALMLYLVWFVVAFGARTLLQVRRTGDSGLRLTKEQGGVARVASGLIAFAMVGGFVATVGAALGLLDPIPPLDLTALRVTGVLIAVLGGCLTFAAQLAMGDAWRIGVDPDERTTLVRSGPFGLVRNPIFSAMLLTSAGLTLMVPNVAALVTFLALIVGLELQVRLVEEPYLQRHHGAAYSDYAAAVGRFVPGLGRELSAP